MTEYKNLKDYIVEYKNGNIEVLSDLITTRKVKEVNENKQIDYVYRLKFNDKALDNIYLNLCSKYKKIDWKDLDHLVYQAIFDIKEDGSPRSLFDDVDVNKSPNEVLNFIKTRLTDRVKDFVKKQNEDYYNHITRDESVNEEGHTYYKTDEVAFNTYKEVENTLNTYTQFKKYIGGSVEKILSNRQSEVYQLLKIGLTQQQIADQLNISQQAVSDILAAIKNRLTKHLIEWKALKNYKANKNTYQIINNFMENDLKIIEYDITNSFDYFGYMIDFLKQHYAKGEQDISFEQLHKNKSEFGMSVIDVLVDRVNAKTYKILEEYIFKNETNLKLTKREKMSFVNNIRKAFNTYLSEVKKAVGELSNKIVSDKNNKYLIDLIK